MIPAGVELMVRGFGRGRGRAKLRIMQNSEYSDYIEECVVIAWIDKKGSHEDIFELDGDTDKDVMKELHDEVKDATNIHVVRKLKGLIV